MDRLTIRSVCFSLFLHLLVILAVIFSDHSSASERIELYDATLQDFIEWSSPQLGKSVVVGSDIKSSPISLFATYSGRAELEKLLEDTVISSGFFFSSSGNTIRISSNKLPESPDLVTEVFQLLHLQSDFATQAIRDVLSSNAEAQQSGASQAMASPSPTSNAIIVTGTARQLSAVRSVLGEIDRPRRQVVITAVVAELTDTDFEALGLNVAADASRLELGGVSVRPSDRSDLGFSMTFSGPHLSAFLQAVKATGRNKILSTPQLLTLNREPASIVVGQNVPFITGQTTSGSTPASDPFQTIVRQDVGVSLEVTPFITPANAIELQVNQSASSVANDTTAADIITNTRKISTRIQLRDGEGVLLGGLRSEQMDDNVSRVPGLSSIPVIGKAFQYRSRRKTASNLIVLLTARIHTEGDALAVRDPVRPIVLPTLSVAGEGVGAAGALASDALRASQ